MKEIKLSPNIADNDIEYRVKQAIKFLESGEQVKLSMRIIGRQRRTLAASEKGKRLIEDFVIRCHGNPQGPIKVSKTFEQVSGLVQIINPKKK